ncbi:RTA1-domain-containing protein [Sporormia fimetaria CBS 119925]|uniref:RTA1-domain-containing protein n=1 Tax=Sporormia fimetaria CBS 119925 TaxID=1340428 RepID=A0A6A6V0J0_9PLEO|nr:RTA1-domain-containing protein [Sporormia fimetaria CBS 119925]
MTANRSRSASRTLFVSLALLSLLSVTKAQETFERPSYRTCQDGVSARCPVEATTYGYYPDLGVNAFFLGFFALLFLASLGIGIWSRTWTYTLALGGGTFLEAVGYAGRVMMHSNPWTKQGFEMQICCLILGPSFVAAAIYLTLKHFVLYCGPQYSLLKARLYPWVFVGCDFASIVLQAIGGGVAASGGSSDNIDTVNVGNNVIITGIAFQVATMSACGLLVAIYLWRYRKGRAEREASTEKSAYEVNKSQGAVSRRFYVFGGMVALAYVTILIRCIYRLPEMAGGWGNPLMRKEGEFLLLDGMMVAIACFVLVVFHPAFFFEPFRAFRQRKAVTNLRP